MQTENVKIRKRLLSKVLRKGGSHLTLAYMIYKYAEDTHQTLPTDCEVVKLVNDVITKLIGKIDKDGNLIIENVDYPEPDIKHNYAPIGITMQISNMFPRVWINPDDVIPELAKIARVVLESTKKETIEMPVKEELEPLTEIEQP